MENRIMEEAIKLLKLKGVKFTMNELATELSVSKRTLYEHFPSKNHLINKIVDCFLAEIKVKEEKIALDTTLSLIEKIKLLLVCVPAEREAMDARLLLELKKYHYDQWEKVQLFLKEEWNIITHLLEQAKDEGILKDISIPLFIEIYIGAFNNAYTSLSEHNLTLGELLQQIVEILMNGIKA
ncbi:TetR/AcrR family transcriptional regulator [Priestia endophytica]|uniref:TetR family transcriptional regulator n=1 Tax=Priestia endophytica TaxID=135735 RepID=A0AAX1Q433_9BACI|nr:TetR/AcrR family transcriptional regulator [Priestia endophytica]RAS73333.1 TetR family transcriptional regulator [Priestia endophytica]